MLLVAAMAALLAAALTIADDASAQESYWNLAVAESESLTLADGEFTVEGNVEVFGELVLDNCSFDMTNEFSAAENEIRIQPGGSLIVRDCTMTSTANLTPMRVLYDQFIEADPVNASYYEESLETAFAQLNATAAFRVVLDEGELVLNRVNASRGRLWLVGGNATLFDTRLDGETSLPENIGLFIEDTDFLASNLTLDNYGTCLRAVGVTPVLSNLAYGDCTVPRVQEWWLTVTIEDSNGERLEGLHVVQRDDVGNTLGVAEEQPDGSYVDWYEEYRLLGNGSRVEQLVSSIAVEYYGELYSLQGSWEGDLDGNAQVTITVETNRSLLRFSDMRFEVSGQPVEPSLPVAKWSTLIINATLENPTDYRMFIGVQLAVNDVTGYASAWVEVAPRSDTSLELVWNISLAGDLSLSLVADNHALPDGELRISRYLQVVSDASESGQEQSWQEQPWLALLLLLALAGGAAWALLSEEAEPEAGEAADAEEEADSESEVGEDANEAAEVEDGGNGGDAPGDDEPDKPADGGGSEEADELAGDDEDGNADAESPDDDD